jgi:hypothetical protein
VIASNTASSLDKPLIPPIRSLTPHVASRFYSEKTDDAGHTRQACARQERTRVP